MASSTVRCPSLTIPDGQAASNWLKASEVYGDALALTLYGPSSLPGDTFVIECADEDGNFVNVFQHGDPSADATPPGAGKTRTYYDLPPLARIRIKDQTGNVTGAKTWGVGKLVEVR